MEDLGLQNTFKEASATNLDYQNDVKIMTSQPWCVNENGKLVDPAGGITECYISGYLKRKIVSTPGIGAAPPVPPEKVYRISEAHGKGLGMYATQDIHAGDLIVAERPLLVVPRNISSTRPGEVPEYLTMHQIHQVMLHDTEQVYTALLERQDPERKEAFMKLANSHRSDGSGPILGRVRTNGFGDDEMRDLGELNS